MPTNPTDLAPIPFILVDDHDLVRNSLASMFHEDPSLHLLAEASGVEDAIALLEKHSPQIALVDMMLGKGSGLDIVRHVEGNSLPIKILMITGMTSPVLINHALSLPSVGGFVSKYDTAQEVSKGLRSVAAGESYLGESLREVIETLPNSETKLTVREFQIMALVADGLEDKEISHRLDISLPTVKTHRRNLRAKLGVRNSAELTRYAITGRR